MKSIWFDMDGTLAELYAVEDWLPKLCAENPEPYIVAAPKIDTDELARVLESLKNAGYIIGVISWLSMNASDNYKREIRKAKKEWLARHINFTFDRIHLVRYGAPKHIVATYRHGILVDDNAEVRAEWERYGGSTIDATPIEWLEELKGLI